MIEPNRHDDLLRLPDVPEGVCPACYQALGDHPRTLIRTTIRVCGPGCAKHLRGYLLVTKARLMFVKHGAKPTHRDVRDLAGVSGEDEERRPPGGVRA